MGKIFSPPILGMLCRQAPIEGDDALLCLARNRFTEANCQAEIHPVNPVDLAWLLRFLPPGNGHTAHLPRHLNPLQAIDRDLILAMARAGEGQVTGFILHDRTEFTINREQTLSALHRLHDGLCKLPSPPILYLEFSGELTPERYASLLGDLAPLDRISACIDSGHVGIHVCRHQLELSTGHPADRLGRQDPSSRGRSLNRTEQEGLVHAMGCALPAVKALIRELGGHGKPLHLHLHDAHPLSTLSRFGVADHLSFLQSIAVSKEDGTRVLTPGIYGVKGLHELLSTLCAPSMPAVSLTLEIHPQPGRTPLERFAPLFSHWKDKTHAEEMNFWLDRILDNVTLLRTLTSTLSVY